MESCKLHGTEPVQKLGQTEHSSDAGDVLCCVCSFSSSIAVLREPGAAEVKTYLEKHRHALCERSSWP
jgi:hypothetical protein